MSFLEILREKPVIAGIRDFADIPIAISNGARVFFLLCGDIFMLREVTNDLHANSKLALAHLDLIKGVGKDEAGLRYMAKEMKLDGILTTRTNLIQAAKKEGLLTIHRVFLIDSESLSTGISVVQKSEPDALEILPGIIFPQIASMLPVQSLPPIIAGGLITKVEEVKRILSAGAAAVSTSKKELWGYLHEGSCRL